MKQPNDNKQQPGPGGTERIERSTSSAAASAAPGENGSEPVARRLATPALLFAVLAAFLFWSDTHILSQGGEFDSRVYYPFASSNELASLSIREPRNPLLDKGQAVFSMVCQACHQVDGLGGVPQGCPPLAGSDWVLRDKPERIIAIVLKGLTGPVTVSGKEYGTGAMVGLESFSDDEIAGVLSFVRNNWSNKAPLVEVSDVKQIRDKLKGRTAPMTAPELMQMFP
jgi:mono/diheme cytochrome c family protein